MAVKGWQEKLAAEEERITQRTREVLAASARMSAELPDLDLNALDFAIFIANMEKLYELDAKERLLSFKDRLREAADYLKTL